MKTWMRSNSVRIAPSYLGGLVPFEIAYLLAYRFGISFTQQLAAPFWFPDSVLLCALLVSPAKTWWIYIAATLPVRLFLFVPSGTPLWFLLACVVNDSLKALLAAWLLRGVSRPPVWLESLRGFIRYFLVAVTLSPALSAAAGAMSRVYFGDKFWTAWSNWFLGDALASLMLTPLFVSLVTDRPRSAQLGVKDYVGALVIVGGLTAGAYLAFNGGLGNQSPFLLYLPVPFLLWAAVSFGPRGASSGLSLMTLVAIFATIAGGGSFETQSAGRILFSMQLFLFCISVPFMFLSVLSNQQRKTSKSLRESEQRFRSLVDAAPVMVWMCGEDAQCTFLNKPWLDFTGRSLESQLGSGWLQVIHPDDQGTCAYLCRTAFETQKRFVAEYRVRRHDGTYRWVLDHGLPRFEPDGKFIGFIGTCIDITDRKESEDKLRQLSAQVIDAQETERFRIGQELHDDLSQRAATLAMRISHLWRKYDNNQPLTADFGRLRQQAMDLCIDITRLSHQLHPTTLDRLGLGVALRTLCEQSTSDERKIVFVCDDELPQLPNEVSVPLYRVAQESLHNALRHSGAAYIEVELKYSATTLSLAIRDWGCGFVVGSSKTNGLGLSGMTERMRNVGGSLSVVSSPGAGTTITATLPTLKSMKAIK
jgi:PAS domain S-box-containing protein